MVEKILKLLKSEVGAERIYILLGFDEVFHIVKYFKLNTFKTNWKIISIRR